MAENRLTQRLIAYWNLLKKDKIVPEFAQFNASAISDIWQQCVLFTVQPSAEMAPPVINFSMIGDHVLSIYDKDMLGKSVSASQSHFQGATIVRRAHEVINLPGIILDDGQFVSKNGKIVKFRSCLMPFGTKDDITHIVVGLSWREY